MTKVVGGKIPPKEHRKLKVEDHLDRIFNKLIFAKLTDDIKDIRRDCMFLPEDMGPMWAHIPSEKDDLMFNAPEEVNHPKLVWPLRVGIIHDIKSHDEWGPHLELNWWESAAAEKLRGRYRFTSKYNIGWFMGKLTNDMRFMPCAMYGAWHSGKWMTAQRIKYNQDFLSAVNDGGTAPLERYVATGEDDIGIRCALGQSVGLTYRYEWGAQFSIGKTAKVIVPTTPRGILELFNDRNKPVDRDRRAALRHWVSQHARRRSAGDFTHVRAHLRGQTKFQWRGFDVTIRPSQFDREKAEA